MECVEQELRSWEGIPHELRERRQWIVWKWGRLRKNGKRAKEPCNIATGLKASGTDPANWNQFEAVCETVLCGYLDGLGYSFGPDDPYTGIDLDHCVDPQTGEIAPWAWSIVERLNSYTEVSPSGTGLRIWVRGTVPQDRKIPNIEAYHEPYKHYVTVTGHHVTGTPTTVEDRQVELEAWYSETFPPKAQKAKTQRAPEPVDIDDDDLLARAKVGAKGALFTRLWSGDWTGFASQSEADMALMGMLAFWTGDDEDRMRSLFEASALYRSEKGEGYLDRTIAQAVANNTDTYRKRDDRRVVHRFGWQKRTETPEEREALLDSVSEWAKEQVRAHFERKGTGLLVVTTAPGTGKSHAVSQLGTDFDIAWIAERHAQVDSVKALKEDYREILPCNRTTCPTHHHIHQALVGKGKAWPVHAKHDCLYGRQHRAQGSAVYQLEHVQTAYPVKHEVIVVDEMSLSSWVRTHAVTPQTIQEALASPWSLTAHGGLRYDAERFLESLWKAITQAQRDQKVLTGKALFDALHQVSLSQGRALGPLVCQLVNDWKAMELLPIHNINPDDEDVIAKIESLPPVVLPLVLRAFVAELEKWEKGTEWNSSLRIANGKDGWALYFLEPRKFPTEEGKELPPWGTLDATGDKASLERLTGMKVEIVHQEVLPPPRMRHIAVRPLIRNGGTKRYGKYSMVGAKSANSKKHADEYRKIVAAEMLSLLRELDPTGELRAAGRVGLITFQGCEQVLAEAVGIPEGCTGHFGAIRGSNRLEGCDILFVVGTFVPNLEQIEWYARMLYRNDPKPIETTTEEVDGRKVYKDPRLRELTKYLSHAELTQCAHRNRPLRYDGRVVVTMCVGEIADLPATETITEFPQLTEDGLRHDEARLLILETVYAELVGEGKTPSVRKMRDRLRMRRVRVEQGVLCTWLKSKRAAAAGLAA